MTPRLCLCGAWGKPIRDEMRGADGLSVGKA